MLGDKLFTLIILPVALPGDDFPSVVESEDRGGGVLDLISDEEED